MKPITATARTSAQRYAGGVSPTHNADMLTTENYLAELIRQTGLDRECDCRVCRMKQKDDFLNEFQDM